MLRVSIEIVDRYTAKLSMDVDGLHVYGCFLDHTLCTSCGFAALVIASWKGWLRIGDAGSDEMII